MRVSEQLEVSASLSVCFSRRPVWLSARAQRHAIGRPDNAGLGLPESASGYGGLGWLLL
jgi:hypothetical protein